MGSGVVGFNIEPKNAIFSDSNPHIIQFYNDIKYGILTPENIKYFLECESIKLADSSIDKNSYYYTVRNRFNKQPNSFDFIFLQRSNFNGMIRFGPNGYNVPFCRNIKVFSESRIKKIVNQVEWVSYMLKNNSWEFINCDYEESISNAIENDFVYLDPPYIGRSTTYYNSWDINNANNLANISKTLPCGYALSMWYSDKHRINDNLTLWDGEIITTKHNYILGGKKVNRNEVVEALVIKTGFNQTLDSENLKL